MRLAAFLIVLIALAACASYAGADGLFNTASRQQQIMRDTSAILHGMAQARADTAGSAACNSATQPRNEQSPCR